MWIPVAARSMHRQRVRLRDGELKRASVFPFFDSDGRTLALMLVWPPARRIVVLEHRPDLVRARWSGEVLIDAHLAALRDIDTEQTGAVAGLWHYDPWWVLRETRFKGHPAVPVLKATNCVHAFLKPVHGCYFRRDLSQLVGVSIGSPKRSALSALEPAYQPYSADILPVRRASAPLESPRPSREWQLDPYWLRDDWHRRSPRLPS